MFESLFGGVYFLKFFVLGLFFGLAYEICKLTKIISKNNIFIVNTIQFVYFFVLGVFFCGKTLSLCDGVVHFYCIAATILGIVIEQICIGFFFTKFYKMVYNMFTKAGEKIKLTALGNKILR